MFERVILVLDKESGKGIWDKMMVYENLYGEESVLNKLETRRCEDYPGIN